MEFEPITIKDCLKIQKLTLEEWSYISIILDINRDLCKEVAILSNWGKDFFEGKSYIEIDISKKLWFLGLSYLYDEAPSGFTVKVINYDRFFNHFKWIKEEY